MIDYARPFDPNMCEFLLTPTPPAPTRLEDFQVFKKHNPNYIYANYYHNYDMYTEPEMDSTTNVYHDLVTSRENRHEEWRYKAIIDWSPDDTTYWLIDTAMTQGFSEYDVPFYNFKISGVDLRHMRPEEFFQRMVHPSVDTNLSRRIADIVYDKLHARINEEMLRQTPLFRYGESDYQAHEPVQTMLDLDSLDHKNRLYASDYKPNDSSLLQAADSSDDADDAFRPDTASPECSYGSEGSKSGDEDKKRFKRPPGRPKGTGRKVSKRPRSVSVPEFLRNLLLDKNYCPSIIKWEDHLQGKFRFVKPDEVAKLWGHLKQNDNMTFEKFSRAMRYHYRQSVLVSVPTARLVYQFGPKGPNFKTENPNFVKVKSEVHDMSYSNS